MTTVLQINLGEQVGKTTCIRASLDDGPCCPMIRVRKFGQVWSCYLFEKELMDTDGWLQRLPECLEAEVGGTQC